MTAFEDALWTQLVDEHDADRVTLSGGPKRDHRRPTIVGGSLTVAAIAVATGVIALSGTGAPPAYALTQNADGSFTVTIHDMSAAIPELNARFRQMGIDETVVPVETSCPAQPDNGPAQGLQVDDQETGDMTLTFNPKQSHLAPGFHGVLAAEQLPNGEFATVVGAYQTVPSCFPTTAYKLVRVGTTAAGLPEYEPVAVNPNAPVNSTGGSATTPSTPETTSTG